MPGRDGTRQSQCDTSRTLEAEVIRSCNQDAMSMTPGKLPGGGSSVSLSCPGDLCRLQELEERIPQPQKSTGLLHNPRVQARLNSGGRRDGKGFPLFAEVMGSFHHCVVSEQLLATLSAGPTAGW